MSADRKSSGEVKCGLCGSRMNFPFGGYAWTNDGIYHVFCYENPHLYQDDVDPIALREALQHNISDE